MRAVWVQQSSGAATANNVYGPRATVIISGSVIIGY